MRIVPLPQLQAIWMGGQAPTRARMALAPSTHTGTCRSFINCHPHIEYALFFYIFLRKKIVKLLRKVEAHDKEKETVPPRVYIEERKELSFGNAKKKKKKIATGGTCEL